MTCTHNVVIQLKKSGRDLVTEKNGRVKRALDIYHSNALAHSRSGANFMIGAATTKAGDIRSVTRAIMYVKIQSVELRIKDRSEDAAQAAPSSVAESVPIIRRARPHVSLCYEDVKKM